LSDKNITFAGRLLTCDDWNFLIDQDVEKMELIGGMLFGDKKPSSALLGVLVAHLGLNHLIDLLKAEVSDEDLRKMRCLLTTKD